ncbi:uncharacterized protein [Dermacentor albipictus]|uniref:uncharacterized protein n=1 Tax=Dermacentor albipictus TaxID=60249 RepID=UPI0031FD6345
MKRHTPWIAVLILYVTAEVRSRNYQGPSWRLRNGMLLERSLRLQPSWTPQRGWNDPEERMAEEAPELGERSSLGGPSSAEVAESDVSGLDSLVDESAIGVGASGDSGRVDKATQTNSSEEDVKFAAPHAGALRAGPDDSQHYVVRKSASVISDISFVVLVAGCSAVAVFGVVAAGYCFYKVQKNARAAADVDYPAYGVTGPNKEGASPTADRKLAQSAQMYHFQHQKQQMIAVEKNHTNRHTSASDVDTEEEENEEGDYTVYECPGMASGGELEVKNPLFQDDHPIVLATPEDLGRTCDEERKKRSP